jgi:hypothetical protein
MSARGYLMSLVPTSPPGASPRQQTSDAAPATADASGHVVAVLRALDAALRPVIGHRGVAALCHRSLHLSARRHPWLGELSFDPAAAIDLDRVAQVLAAHPDDDARAAGDALLQDFHDLLASLLGAALTQQLVGGNWPALPQAPAAQDKSP